MLNTMSKEKLSLKEKLGYGFGDAACSMFWKLFTMYLMFFYTDVFGISAAAVGTMFLVTRLWDAANDPLMGILADRTSTRWGKFRPYILFGSIPFCFIAVLTFITPDFGYTGKIVWAYLTYSILMTIYTIINVPYASLMGVMTSDLKERTSLATYRFIFAFGGSILVLAAFQPLFDKFGVNELQAFTASRVEAKGAVSPLANTTVYVWNAGSTIPQDHVSDSLLFLDIKVKTSGSDAFALGLYNKTTDTYHWAHFGQGTDTMGLIRDGSWSEVRLNLLALTKLKNLPPASQFTLAMAAPASMSVHCKKMSIKEIDYKSGTVKAVLVVSMVALVFFLLTFFWTKEKVKPLNINQSSLKEDLKDLWKNRPWFILLGAGIMVLIFNSIRDGAAIYYFKYVIQSQEGLDLTLFGSALTFTYVTFYFVLGQAANIIGVLLAKPLSDKVGKSNTFLSAMMIASLLSVLFFWMGRDTVMIIFVLQFFISICAGIIFPMLWSMYADTADYSEWKNGRRATGLVFSASSMSQKLGWTLGSALTAWLLALYGFEAGVVQDETTQTGIRLMLSIFPAIGAFISAIFIFFYQLNDKFMRKISGELAGVRTQLSS